MIAGGIGTQVPGLVPPWGCQLQREGEKKSSNFDPAIWVSPGFVSRNRKS